MKEHYEIGERVEMTYPGLHADDRVISNAYIIEVHHLYQGGVDPYPGIDIRLRFPVGAERRAVRIAQALAKWIALTFDGFAKLSPGHEWQVRYKKGYKDPDQHDTFEPEPNGIAEL